MYALDKFGCKLDSVENWSVVFQNFVKIIFSFFFFIFLFYFVLFLIFFTFFGVLPYSCCAWNVILIYKQIIPDNNNQHPRSKHQYHPFH